ncbi:four-carbon acid sugar kinase family protein [Staphylococcus simiae]|uniref:four-carbon acid sugar kinase family protein n=1 Tax=Staphylococcus simiae TaxID=308354 RepID=UPI001A95B0F0|nr:four-carbon acid sugar kinase family protein [Staphylococcus simiae]MBO1198423.1 four-carbon acid sugar kinase family protein [Staphylococcus simiae]MBO1200617.1 four-carbon acid sugar kinase family protein [Staphylococcus simiae]MBO1202888.1 four-carbon acid sugar kinase family protein [Staphylococcus simiae]MBO1210414.1 four-carbon acid sugar kinase family protein [Staphylococcus simiae]MBO1228954.1 four-carbon acid sugar kinase family protein [Staphylococcus simiae]
MKIGVIADDLTGGNGTGVKLNNLGFNVATMINYDSIPSNEIINATVVNTDSRYSSERVAKNRIKTAVHNLKEWNTDIFCKRIDSTVRGNIGIEIDEMLNQLDEEAIVILVPTYPESNRTMVGGYLLLHNVPIELSDVSMDPVKPITSSYVPELIGQQTENKVSHIPLSQVLKGEKNLKQQMNHHIDNGSKIIVVDAITSENIEVIGKAMVLIDHKLLVPADPGPLTETYVKSYSIKNLKQKKILLTVGSVTQNSHNQLKYLQEKREIGKVYVDSKQLATDDENKWEKTIRECVEHGKDMLHENNILLMTTDHPNNEIINLDYLAKQNGKSQDFYAKRISDGLAKITRLIIEESEYHIGGCFSSGGDVTASLCAIGKTEGIELKDEVLPLISYGVFLGGYFEGLPIITKGGTAGEVDAVYTAVKYLENKF